MRNLIMLAAVLLAGCTNHLPEQQPVTPGVDQPPPGASIVTLRATGGNPSWEFSDNHNTITGFPYTRSLDRPLGVTCLPPLGEVVGGWEGADWESGDEAWVLPRGEPRTLTAVLAPAGDG